VGIRVLAVFLCATIFLAQTGCATRPEVPAKPPTEDLRSTFGRIEVVANRDVTPIKLSGPAKGSGDGAGRGALLGAGVSLSIIQGFAQASAGGRELGAFVFLAGVALAIAVLPFAVLIGALYGMSAAPSSEKVKEAVNRLVRAVEESRFSATVAAARMRTDEQLPEQGPYDTSIEIGAPEIWLTGPYRINPTLTLAVIVPVRVVRGGQELYKTALVWKGTETGELFEWADANAAKLRQRLSMLPDLLVGPAVHKMFLMHELPQDREWRPSK
jgi:hypothetical protein